MYGEKSPRHDSSESPAPQHWKFPFDRRERPRPVRIPAVSLVCAAADVRTTTTTTTTTTTSPKHVRGRGERRIFLPPALVDKAMPPLTTTMSLTANPPTTMPTVDYNGNGFSFDCQPPNLPFGEGPSTADAKVGSCEAPAEDCGVNIHKSSSCELQGKKPSGELGGKASSGECHGSSGAVTSGRDSAGGLVCRICHEADEDEDLIAPCYCAGTMGLIHRTCMQRWLTASNLTSCELCNCKIQLRARKKNVMAWLRWTVDEWSSERDRHRRQVDDPETDGRHLLGDGICFLFLTPMALTSAGLCAQSALEKGGQPWEAAGLTMLTGFLLAIYCIWISMSVRFHLSQFHAWQEANLEYFIAATPYPPQGGRVKSRLAVRVRREGSVKNEADIRAMVRPLPSLAGTPGRGSYADLCPSGDREKGRESRRDDLVPLNDSVFVDCEGLPPIGASTPNHISQVELDCFIDCNNNNINNNVADNNIDNKNNYKDFINNNNNNNDDNRINHSNSFTNHDLPSNINKNNIINNNNNIIFINRHELAQTGSGNSNFAVAVPVNNNNNNNNNNTCRIDIDQNVDQGIPDLLSFRIPPPPPPPPPPSPLLPPSRSSSSCSSGNFNIANRRVLRYDKSLTATDIYDAHARIRDRARASAQVAGQLGEDERKEERRKEEEEKVKRKEEKRGEERKEEEKKGEEPTEDGRKMSNDEDAVVSDVATTTPVSTTVARTTTMMTPTMSKKVTPVTTMTNPLPMTTTLPMTMPMTTPMTTMMATPTTTITTMTTPVTMMTMTTTPTTPALLGAGLDEDRFSVLLPKRRHRSYMEAVEHREPSTIPSPPSTPPPTPPLPPSSRPYIPEAIPQRGGGGGGGEDQREKSKFEGNYLNSREAVMAEIRQKAVERQAERRLRERLERRGEDSGEEREKGKEDAEGDRRREEEGRRGGGERGKPPQRH